MPITLLFILIICYIYLLSNCDHELPTHFNPTNLHWLFMPELYKLGFVIEFASAETSSRA